jgi:[ribosomal protein S5]-alanine N-acetyltransferase
LPSEGKGCGFESRQMHQKNMNKFPDPIKIGDFILRELDPQNDCENFLQYYSNVMVNRYVMNEVPKNADEALHDLNYWRNIFYKNDGIYFAIATKENKMIGTVGIFGHNAYNSRMELGYDLSQEFWGQRIMTRAVVKLLYYAFNKFKVNRVEAVTRVENEKSMRVLQKCRFKYEGRLRQHRYQWGSYVDVNQFSLLKEEYVAAIEESRAKMAEKNMVNL